MGYYLNSPRLGRTIIESSEAACKIGSNLRKGKYGRHALGQERCVNSVKLLMTIKRFFRQNLTLVAQKFSRLTLLDSSCSTNSRPLNYLWGCRTSFYFSPHDWSLLTLSRRILDPQKIRRRLSRLQTHSSFSIKDS
mmetsp:Transcript_22978/g.25990  ORF Transcript_22978/g.25990 Transcript_22978/m.25990 type:complete len:136 (-) Transcript_22978:461-868(-)